MVMAPSRRSTLVLPSPQKVLVPREAVDSGQWLNHPLWFISMCWPDIRLYDKQAEVMMSVSDNVETFCHAAHELGKDFIAALAVLWFFSSRQPCKIITTSSNQDQLRNVLWAEMRTLIEKSKLPLDIDVGDMRIRRIRKDGTFDPASIVLGKVVQAGESFAGFHLGIDDRPRTMCVFDEASSIADMFYDSASSWADRILVIGNPLPCTNFFYTGCKGGDLEDPADWLESRAALVEGERDDE